MIKLRNFLSCVLSIPFEIHEVVLRRLWKTAYRARLAFLKRCLNQKMWGISGFQQLRSGVYYTLERTTRRWYMNHHVRPA